MRVDLACVRADETGKGRTDARARVRAGETDDFMVNM